MHRLVTGLPAAMAAIMFLPIMFLPIWAHIPQSGGLSWTCGPAEAAIHPRQRDSARADRGVIVSGQPGKADFDSLEQRGEVLRLVQGVSGVQA